MVDMSKIYNIIWNKDVKEPKDVAERFERKFANSHFKKLIWKGTIVISKYCDVDVQGCLVILLGSAFPHVADKRQAWNDLFIMTKNKDLRMYAIYALVSAFPHVTEKEDAWNDILEWTKNDKSVQGVGAYALSLFFPHVIDKIQATKDILELRYNKNREVQSMGVYVLGQTFPYVTDKEAAWNYIIGMTKDCDMLKIVAYALGSSFPYLTDEQKKKAWGILIVLSEKQCDDITISANYSLGRASIYKATVANSDYEFREGLEKALEFFEKQSKNPTSYKISEFCIPFYRSFHTLIFDKNNAESKVQEYLIEAKNSALGSKSKEKLLEALEKLSYVIKEMQNINEMDLETRKAKLNTLRHQFESVSEILDLTKGSAPIATQFIKRSAIIIKKSIGELLDEIQEKAKNACQQSKGTDTEEVACTVNQIVQEWKVGTQNLMEGYVENLILSLKSKIPSTAENKPICDKIDALRKETDITKQYEILPTLIALIPDATIHKGDVINVSGVTTTGDENQIIVKGNDNKSAIDINSISKKSLLGRMSSSASFAGFIGLLATEIGTFLYPISYNHIISIIIALLLFIIVTIFNKR